MANDYESLKRALATPGGDGFGLLAEVAAFSSESAYSQESTDLVIRALEQRDRFASEGALLDAIALRHGLYPYVPQSRGQSLPERVAFELHRPNSEMGVTFHRIQAEIFHRLMRGENVVLSAPTSFGKTLIVDALATSGKFPNIAMIVPTIALLDETRRRLSKLRTHKVITHPGQTFGERNLLVMTQERLLALRSLPPLDLIFVDEFYKLSDEGPDGMLNARAALLNRAFRLLLSTGAQFYLAGPSIKSLADFLPDNITAAFVRTDFATVAADTIRLSGTNEAERRAETERVLWESDASTLIYCQSPARVRKVLGWLLDDDPERNYGEGLQDAAEWIEQNYHEGWIIARGLRRGIGAHHGRLPRWLAQQMVDGFNGGQLGVLICTNTLIEGVNTRAKRIIILDRKIANRAYNYFTFANIRGRAGRMLRHFVGTIYLFHAEPVGDLPEIDIPILSQSDSAPTSVLLQIDEADRTESTNERLRPIVSQTALSVSTISAVVGVEPEQQIALAQHLRGVPKSSLQLLQWSSAYPTYDQMRYVTRLIWEYLPPEYHMNHGARSADQLTRQLANAAVMKGSLKAIIADFIGDGTWWSDNQTVDDRIEEAFDFMRFWVDHNYPMLVRAVDQVAAEVLRDRGMTSGSFAAFASRVEEGFHAPLVATLEEFGLPVEVTERLLRRVGRCDELDVLIERLSELVGTPLPELSTFERKLLEETIGSV